MERINAPLIICYLTALVVSIVAVVSTDTVVESTKVESTALVVTSALGLWVHEDNATTKPNTKNNFFIVLVYSFY